MKTKFLFALSLFALSFVLLAIAFPACLRNGKPDGALLKPSGTNIVELPDDHAISIARSSFSETPLATNPPPVVRHEGTKTVVYLPRYRHPEVEPRVFPRDWLPVWIDNETGEVVPSPDSVLSEEEALDIAKKEIENEFYDKNGTIQVNRNSVCFVFTFPVPFRGDPGTHLGPDFAFKVGIDSTTKQVLFVEAGY